MKRILTFAAVVLAFGSAAIVRGDDGQATQEALFKKLDVNGDGKLTASEIPPEQRKFFERLVRVGDSDKNGELTHDEFIRALKQTEDPVTDIGNVGNLGTTAAARPKLDPNRIFQTLDKNKDGKLTRDELNGRPQLQALFDRLGKDELTFDDVATALGKAGKAKGKKAAKKGQLAQAAEMANKDSQEMSDKGTDRPLPGILRMLDTNHDGRLSADELSKAGALFEKLDRNHDGFLDTSELMSPPPAGDGAAMKTAAIRPGKRAGKFHDGSHLIQMIMRADANGDGKISEEEAPPQLKKHFAKLDTNGDGFLDKGELDAWIKHRQKRQGGAENKQDSTAENANPKPSGI